MQRPRLPDTSHHSEEDSSSDEEELPVDVDRYQQLELAVGLHHRATRVRALQELLAILPYYTRRANKAVQASIFADLQAAATACDARRGVVKAAVSELLKAAERLLPQQKRAQLASGHKRAMLQQARQGKRMAQGTCTEDDTDEDTVLLTDLPLPDFITLSILSQLDPLALARATAVCRAWRALVGTSGLWHDWAQCLYPKHVKHANTKTGTCCKWDAGAFSSLAIRDPHPVLPFKQPPRIYTAGHMRWSAQAIPAAQLHTATSKQVVQQEKSCARQQSKSRQAQAKKCQVSSNGDSSNCYDSALQQKAQVVARRHGQHATSRVLLPTPQQVAQWLVHEWPRQSCRQHAAATASGYGVKSSYRETDSATDSSTDGDSSDSSDVDSISERKRSALEHGHKAFSSARTVCKLWDIKL